jgi:hypothetical protein
VWQPTRSYRFRIGTVAKRIACTAKTAVKEDFCCRLDLGVVVEGTYIVRVFMQ